MMAGVLSSDEVIADGDVSLGLSSSAAVFWRQSRSTTASGKSQSTHDLEKIADLNSCSEKVFLQSGGTVYRANDRSFGTANTEA